jgi:hypothetical protein
VVSGVGLEMIAAPAVVSAVGRAMSDVGPGMTAAQPVVSGVGLEMIAAPAVVSAVGRAMSDVGPGMTAAPAVVSAVGRAMSDVGTPLNAADHAMSDGAAQTVTAASRRSSGTASGAEPRGCPPSRAANLIPPSAKA